MEHNSFENRSSSDHEVRGDEHARVTSGRYTMKATAMCNVDKDHARACTLYTRCSVSRNQADKRMQHAKRNVGRDQTRAYTLHDNT